MMEGKTTCGSQMVATAAETTSERNPLLSAHLDIEGISFRQHIVDRWVDRGRILGCDNSIKRLIQTFRKAMPERPKGKGANWNLFTRSIVHGAAKYLVSDGWRFVVVGARCIAVERVLPHENYERRRR